jgi:MFS family permease
VCLGIGNLPAFIVGLILLGGAQGVFRVVLTSIVAGKAPQHMKGEVIGVISGVFSACSVVGPAIAGPLYEFNHHLPYYVGGVFMIGAFVASLMSSRHGGEWIARP